VQGLAEHFSGPMLHQIGRDNAARILPGVKAT
jgi:hypothetical protein